MWLKYSEKSSNPHHFNTFFNKIHINSKGQMLSHLPFASIRSILELVIIPRKHEQTNHLFLR